MRTFGHTRPDHKPSPVSVITRDELGGQFGRDKRRRVIFTAEAGDVVAMRPAGTRRTLKVQARDVYRWALQMAALNFTRKVKEYKKTMSLKQARHKARKELGL